MIDNEYIRGESICPLIGSICDKKHKNCDICINEEEEWQIEQSVKQVLGEEAFKRMKSMVQICGIEEK